MRLQSTTRDEHGVAMVVAILVTTIVLILSVTAVSLATHNSEATNADRNRTQSVHAAEAGVNRTLQRMNVATPLGLPCSDPTTPSATPTTAALSTRPGGNFTTTIRYFTDIEMSTEIACRTWDEDDPPAAAIVTSTGTTGTRGVGRRTMQTRVNLEGIRGGFGAAVFSESSFAVKNNFNINGEDGNDGHVYSNGDVTCASGALIKGNVTAQGRINLDNSCKVAGDAWARDDLTLAQNSTVAGNGRSSTGRIAISSNGDKRIGGDAKAGSTINRPAQVVGTATPNYRPIEFPPGPNDSTEFPPIKYLPTEWEEEGYEIRNFSDCALAKVELMTVSPQPRVINITTPCTLEITDDLDLASDVGIILSGGARIHVRQVQDFTGVTAGGPAPPHTLYMIVPGKQPPDEPWVPWANCDGTALGKGGIFFEQQVRFENLKLGLYSDCFTKFENNENVTGQIYSRFLEVSQYFTLTYRPGLFPGGGPITSHEVDVLYLREIKNP